MAFRSETVERFMRKLEPDLNSGCWLWSGATTTGSGYGYVRVDKRLRTAHRMAWEIWRGQEPGAMAVCHRCDTPACCNPNHLFLGTHGDNNRDRHSKGRSRGGRQPGARNAASRLSAAQVAEIRRLAASRTETQRSIGRRFGISHSHVSALLLRKRWGGECAS